MRTAMKIPCECARQPLVNAHDNDQRVQPLIPALFALYMQRVPLYSATLKTLYTHCSTYDPIRCSP